MLQVISLLLENKPGALMRVTGLLTQRGYNIESLTVARTLDPELSRMTIVVDVDSTQRTAGHQADEQADQRPAGDRSHRIARRSSAKWCCCASAPRRKAAPPSSRKPRSSAARVVDSSTEGFAIEVTGDPEKLDEFIDVMRSYGEIEVTRSGALAISLESKKLRLQPPVPTKAAV